MSIIVFIIILTFLVIIHEFGHFVMARRAGVKVEEFGVGYPPRAVTLKRDHRGTEYTVNWIPFGGFVRLYGEDGTVSETDSEAKKQGAFFTKPVSKRLGVVFAGAVMNFLFGVLAFGIIYTVIGIPTQYQYAKIEEIAPSSPAQNAGLKSGDEIKAVKVNGQTIAIKSANDFVKAVGDYKGQTISLIDQAGRQVSVYVRKPEETPSGQGAVGVVVTDYEMVHYPVWQMPFRGMAYGVKTAVEFGVMLVQALGGMIAGLFQGQIPKDVAGPVGIAYIAQKEHVLSGGWLPILNFAAILSINLAIVNVLPIPALDGGRAAFLLYEAITKKRVKPEWEQKINAVGFATLIVLLILISVKDIGTVANDAGVKLWLSKFF
jgi:regulator of sigma E protease